MSEHTKPRDDRESGDSGGRRIAKVVSKTTLDGQDDELE